jgi:hypothetical protein
MELEWYFVRLIGNDQFEVQLLDTEGRARSVTQFLSGVRDVHLGDRKIPVLVLEVAERTGKIGSQFVGHDGKLFDFYGRPIECGHSKSSD